MGFDATWFADFYHNLIGDSDMAGGKARLIKSAGAGGCAVNAASLRHVVGLLSAYQSSLTVLRCSSWEKKSAHRGLTFYSVHE